VDHLPYTTTCDLGFQVPHGRSDDGSGTHAVGEYIQLVLALSGTNQDPDPQLQYHVTKLQDLQVFAHECQVEVLKKLNESLYDVILAQVSIWPILSEDNRADGQ